ncbi:hypothetical protein ABU178_05280 [Pantoea osteomyelitidis]|jgi:hypothetical protein|uniref:Uncharacterized protein n=1 Tax=Pantoea osteomyelitidis TaxID=3230026 RepID=A0ABW7PTG5_9GAMM
MSERPDYDEPLPDDAEGEAMPDEDDEDDIEDDDEEYIEDDDELVPDPSEEP